MIRFACPGCSATFTVADEKAGKTGKCPKCQSQFVIPAAEASAGADAPPPLPPPSAPAPSPPPPPADPNEPVEIQPCPKCSTRLSVLPTDVGLDIQCPSCETVFKAMRADAPPPPDTGPKKGSSSLVKLGSGSDKDDDDDDRGSKRKSKRRDDDDDDDDRPSRRRSSRRDDDDDDDDRPSRRRRSRRDDEDDEDDRPSRSRSSRRDDDDDDEEDDRPSRRSRRSKGSSGGRPQESKKVVAGILALLLGSLGVHKFYLGYTTAGILQILLTFCTYVGAIIPIIEGIIYLTKSDKEFINTYQRNEKQWF
jgi:TM2 domain-containing membrane protein YozV